MDQSEVVGSLVSGCDVDSLVAGLLKIYYLRETNVKLGFDS